MKTIDLLEKVIENAVKSAIKEEMASIKKELKEVKVLTAKIIKEGYAQPTIPSTRDVVYGPLKNNDYHQAKRETILKEAGRPMEIPQELKNATRGFDPLSEGGELPDIDVPVDLFFNKDSQVLKSFQEKYQ